jgi:hypothetical protein
MTPGEVTAFQVTLNSIVGVFAGFVARDLLRDGWFKLGWANVAGSAVNFACAIGGLLGWMK